MSGEWIKVTEEQRVKLEEKAAAAGYSRIGDYMLSHALNSTDPIKDYSRQVDEPVAKKVTSLPVVNVDTLANVQSVPTTTSVEPVKTKNYYNLSDKYVGYNVIGPKGEIPMNHYSFEIVDLSLSRNSNIGEIKRYVLDSNPNKRTAFNLELACRVLYAQGNPALKGSILMQNWFFGDNEYSYNRACARLAKLLDVAGMTNVQDAPNFTYEGLSGANLMSLVGLRIDSHIEMSGPASGDKNIFISEIEPCVFHAE